VGQGVLTVESSRSYSNTPQSVGLLWTRGQQTTFTRDTHPCSVGIRTGNPSTPSLRPRGHWGGRSDVNILYL